MFDKLDFIEERYNELTEKISDPDVLADRERWSKLVKEHSDMTRSSKNTRSIKI